MLQDAKMRTRERLILTSCCPHAASPLAPSAQSCYPPRMTTTASRADDYEVKANECLTLSHNFLTPGNSNQEVAQAAATQAVAYALLAQQARMPK